MTSPALILLHAPSVYDFRRETMLRGPVSDLVPSSSVFEMYPIGFTTLTAHLEDHGYPVRVINLASRMLADPNFDVERFIGALPRPMAFGIDLHWLPHAQGALAIAEVVRRCHPGVPILMGGFSATYYHRELMAYPQVDMVIRGDSTEEPVRLLINALADGLPLDGVPNLTWRDRRGHVRINAPQASCPDLDVLHFDYRRLMIAAARDKDLAGYLPFTNWLRYPIMPVVSCRGCIMNCVACGGSAFAFQHMHGRERPAFRSPEALADDLRHTVSVSSGPVFVLGDLRQAGLDYARRFLKAAAGIDATVIIELFWPASRAYLQEVARALPRFALEVSLESHDPAIRRAFGKPYGNSRIEETLRAALDLGVQRLDVFFMIGLPGQTRQSVLDTADYAEYLLNMQHVGGRLRPFIGPLAPFVDPGSLAFEQPEKHGYHIFYRTLEEHRRALLEPSWQFTLNYETRWMTRREIVHSTYEAGLKFNQLKARYGLVEAQEAAHVEHALNEGWELAQTIERCREPGARAVLSALRPRIEAINATRVLEEESELALPVAGYPFKVAQLAILLGRAWVKSWFSHRQASRARAVGKTATHSGAARPAEDSG